MKEILKGWQRPGFYPGPVPIYLWCAECARIYCKNGAGLAWQHLPEHEVRVILRDEIDLVMTRCEQIDCPTIAASLNEERRTPVLRLVATG